MPGAVHYLSQAKVETVTVIVDCRLQSLRKRLFSSESITFQEKGRQYQFHSASGECPTERRKVIVHISPCATFIVFSILFNCRDEASVAFVANYSIQLSLTRLDDSYQPDESSVFDVSLNKAHVCGICYDLTNLTESYSYTSV